MRGISRLVAPLLSHIRASLHSIEIEDSWLAPEVVAVRLRLRAFWRGRTLESLFTTGENVLALCEAFGSGEVTRRAVADLVRGGFAELLVGQPEGNWLDAKSEEYDLTATRGKISLAQAVARFANAEEGGLIVIGAKAKRIPGGEEIREIRGVAPRQTDTQSLYLRVLDRHLYPPVLGIRIDLIPTRDGRGLIAIDIPPQPEELKPFLVHGAITAEGDTEGAFISIVQRRGEGSIPITAPMIHSTLAAGPRLPPRPAPAVDHSMIRTTTLPRVRRSDATTRGSAALLSSSARTTPQRATRFGSSRVTIAEAAQPNPR